MSQNVEFTVETFFAYAGHSRHVHFGADFVAGLSLGSLVDIAGVTYTVIEFDDRGGVLLDRPIEFNCVVAPRHVGEGDFSWWDAHYAGEPIEFVSRPMRGGTFQLVRADEFDFEQ